MYYGEIKKVRNKNGDKFITDFKSIRTIVAYCHYTQSSFVTLKLDVWEMAKRKILVYDLTTDVYANGRLVMRIY